MYIKYIVATEKGGGGALACSVDERVEEGLIFE